MRIIQSENEIVYFAQPFFGNVKLALTASSQEELSNKIAKYEKLKSFW